MSYHGYPWSYPQAYIALDISRSCTLDQTLTLLQIKHCIYISCVLLLSVDVCSKLVMIRHLVRTKTILIVSPESFHNYHNQLQKSLQKLSLQCNVPLPSRVKS